MSSSFDIAGLSTSDGLPDNASRKIDFNFRSMVKSVSAMETRLSNEISMIKKKMEEMEKDLEKAKEDITKLDQRVSALESAPAPEGGL